MKSLKRFGLLVLVAALVLGMIGCSSGAGGGASGGGNNLNIGAWPVYERTVDDFELPTVDIVETLGGNCKIKVTGAVKQNTLTKIAALIDAKLEKNNYPPNSLHGYVALDISEITGLTSIKGFGGLRNLVSIVLPSTITSIGDSAFIGSGLRSITIPESVNSIGYSAFNSCFSLKSVNIPSSVTEIKHHTFSHCISLTSVTIPPNVTSIGEAAFSDCGLTSVTIPSNVTSIGDSAFFFTALTSITFAEGSKLEKIGEEAFFFTDLTSITIPSSVTLIGKNALDKCSGLKSIKFMDDQNWYAGPYGAILIDVSNPANNVKNYDSVKDNNLIKRTN